MNFKKMVRRVHGVVALFSGLIIFSMALTGVWLSFEPQWVDGWNANKKQISIGEEILSVLRMDQLFEKAMTLEVSFKPKQIVLYSALNRAMEVSYGRERRTVYLHPREGKIIGQETRWGMIFHHIENWHRWLGIRTVGKFITGSTCLMVLVLMLSGLILWWPNVCRWEYFKTRIFVKRSLRGRARIRNWHTSVGIWVFPILFLSAVTGTIISFKWANNLFLRWAGELSPTILMNRPEALKEREGRRQGPVSLKSPKSEEVPSFDWRAITESLEKRMPGYKSLRLKIPQKKEEPLVATIEWEGGVQPRRGQLILQPETGEEKSWLPPSLGQAQRGRSWVVLIHTGRGFGIWGQALAALGAMGTMVLVVTGFQLGIDRVRHWKRKKS